MFDRAGIPAGPRQDTATPGLTKQKAITVSGAKDYSEVSCTSLPKQAWAAFL